MSRVPGSNVFQSQNAFYEFLHSNHKALGLPIFATIGFWIFSVVINNNLCEPGRNDSIFIGTNTKQAPFKSAAPHAPRRVPEECHRDRIKKQHGNGP